MASDGVRFFRVNGVQFFRVGERPVLAQPNTLNGLARYRDGIFKIEYVIPDP